MSEAIAETPEHETRSVSETVLEVRNLTKQFGGITAVDGTSFSVERGTLTGLIGPNGAGKSTTFDLITGIQQPDTGSVHFAGEKITGRQPHWIAKQGLVRTFQIARELSNMTVLENLMLPAKGQRGERLANAVLPGLRSAVVEEERDLRDRVWDVIDFFEIDHLAHQNAGTLSGGQRKLLELARALLVDPELLLLDEPFAGVNPTLENKLIEQINQLREQGYSFLIVEHDMDLIMEHCEHVLVMHQGRLLAEGTPEEITSNEQVIEAYLGGDV